MGGTYLNVAGDDYTDLVRFRNDGEDFHINWTTRRALRILGREGLVAVSIEGISDRDRYRGERIDAGLLVADTVEYFGGESFETATRIVLNQIKYSTQDGTTPWPWSEIEPILKGFAVRYKAYVRKVGVSDARAKLRFRFLTNRPISENVEKALAYLAGDVGVELGVHAHKALTEVPAATGLSGKSLAAFLKLVELSGRSESREATAAAAAGEASGFIPSVVRDPVTLLRDLVRRFGTSTHGQDPTIRRETVLHAFGIDDPAKLFPAQPEFEHVPDAVERRQESDLAEFIRGTTRPMLVTASGGTGKSIVAQRVPRLLPEGSEAVVFDGFAGGRYRDPSERRHLHQVGLVQLANELAGKGLCDVLLPIAGSDRDFIVAFRSRLQQAAALIRRRSPDALVVVVLDAADNSVFAGRLHHEAVFVSSLLAEAPPEGCRVVGFARPERLDGLHADTVSRFVLEGFDRDETGALVLRSDLGASPEDFETFRRLTFGNPRVQANQLALEGTLDAAIAALGPGGLSVAALIEKQLTQGLAQVRDAQPEADVDAMCTGLGALPPMVPIRILAGVAGVDEARIASFASDFGGGRPLMLRENALQFRDEPVEKWFNDRFVPDQAAAGRFADRLSPIAQDDAYAALALPQLLLRAGRHAELMGLALADEPGFSERPVERQAIILQRVRFGLRSALELDEMASVSMLLVRAGEQIATSERQEKFLEENADLVPLLSGPEITEDFVHRRRDGNWFGSVNAYKAEMLSVMPETRDEARGFLALAARWLAEWSRRSRLREPGDFPDHEDQLGDDDIAAMLFARCLLDGAEAGAAFTENFRPGEFRFRFVLVCVRKLLDAGRRDVADALLSELRTGESRIAVHLALAWRGATTSKEACEHTIAALVDTKIQDRYFGYDDTNFAAALLAFAEAAAAHGLTSEALSLLGRANWAFSSHPLPDVGDRIEHGLRAAALTAAITNVAPSVERLWEDANRHAKAPLDPVKPTFREVCERLLPTFFVRARVLVGETIDVAAELEKARSRRSLVGFDSWQERLFRGTRMVAEVDALLRAGSLDIETFKACERHAARDGRLWLPECLALIGLLTPHERLHGELIRLAADAAEVGQDPHSDAEVRTGNLAEVARKLLPISRDESVIYFRKALEEADRVGEELHERLYMLLAMGAAAAGHEHAAEYGYRILRLAEVYGQINSHKYPWHEVFKTLARLHAPTAVAGASRLDSRDRVGLATSLPEIGEVLMEAGAITIGAATALHAFGGEWDFEDPRAVLTTLLPDVRRMVTDLILRDMADDRREAFRMRRFVRAAEAFGDVPPDIQALYEARDEAEERSISQRDPRPDPVVDIAAILSGRSVFDPTDLEEAVKEFRTASSYGASLDPLGDAVLALVDVPRRLEHLRALVEANIETEDLLGLLSLAGTAWAASVSVREALRSHALELIERRPFDLIAHRWRRSLEQLRALTRDSAPALLRLLIKTVGSRVDELGSSTLFWLARQCHADLLVPGSRGDVLSFALTRFEAILTPEEPDGDWRPELDPGNDTEATLGALIWTSLGDPNPRRRWRAAHCVRRLARLGEQALLEEVLVRLADSALGGALDPRLPFYEEHARTFLLIAMARISLDDPRSLASAVPRLRELAGRGHRHIMQRFWAAQTLLALNETGLFTPDAAEHRVLLRPFADDPSAAPVPAPPIPADDDDLAYQLPYDFERREASPLANAFEISPGEMQARIGRAVRDEMGREPARRYAVDPRSGLGIYGHGHRTGPDMDRLAEYEASNGLYFVAGELLEGCAEAPDLAGSRSYLLHDQMLSLPPHWLSDRRDPDPTASWAASAVPYADEHWEYSVTRTDFEAALFESADRIRVAGSWTRSSSFSREEANVTTALVRPEFAVDLLRACQTFKGRFPWIPLDGGELNVGYQKMRVTPWIAREEQPGGIDSQDPFVGNLAGVHFPGEVLRRRFGLKPSEDRRVWSCPEGTLALELRSTVWGQFPNDYRDERLDTGDTLAAPLSQVVGALSILERCMISRVRIDRYSGKTSDQEPRTYARYFILDQHGRLDWLGGFRQAWPSADRPTG